MVVLISLGTFALTQLSVASKYIRPSTTALDKCNDNETSSETFVEGAKGVLTRRSDNACTAVSTSEISQNDSSELISFLVIILSAIKPD
jgi:Na+/serine symporter